MSELTTWRRDRDAIAASVRARIADSYRARRSAALAEVISDVEAERGEGNPDDRTRAAWADLVARARAGQDVFDAVVHRYLDDIAGGFDRTTYRAVIGSLPVILGLVFRPGVAGLGGLGARLEIEGPIASLRELAKGRFTVRPTAPRPTPSRSGELIGDALPFVPSGSRPTTTLVFAPTHSSNLDSIVLGYSLARAGLPPSVYAAGKHMYRNAAVARLMGNLGAYRVDRSLTATLYKDVLKAYSAELLERGFHSVIFPGATRCRTNEVESQLKLGLLGTTSRVNRPVAIVPVTINYQIVVEAETLIRYHLEGRASERIVGDQRKRALGASVRRLLALDEVAVVRFGDPIQPGGQLGDAVVDAFRRNTVLFATQLTGRAAFDELTRRFATDIHGLLARAPGDLVIARPELEAAIATLVERLRAHPEAGGIHHAVPRSPREIADAAIHAWTAGHGGPVISRRGDQLVVENPSLVYFYANRTSHLR